MPRIRLLLFMVMMLGCVSVYAQDDDSGTLFYYVQINESFRAEAVKSEYAARLLEDVQQTLADDGINAAFVTDQLYLAGGDYPEFIAPYQDVYPDLFTPPQFVVSLNIETYGETDAVYVTPFAGYEFDPLPIGSLGWTPIGIIDPEVFDSFAQVVDLVVGTGLYTVRECELATPYLEKLANDASFTESSTLILETLAFYRASCAYLAGDVDTAIAFYTEVVNAETPSGGDIDPRLYTDSAATNLAWIYTQLDEVDAASGLLDAYYDMESPGYSRREVERFLDRAEVYLSLGDVEAAARDINRIIEIGRTEGFVASDMAWLFTARGWIRARAGQLQAALNDYDVAIATDPSYPVAYFRRGQLFYETEQYDKAQDDFEQFITLEPDFYNYYEQDVPELVPLAEAYLSSIP